MSNRNRMLALFASGALVVGLAACGGGGSKSSGGGSGNGGSTGGSSSGGGSGAKTTLTIGIDEPISGYAGPYGSPVVEGAKYAVSVVNSQHLLGPNTTLKLAARDDQSTKEQSVQNANDILTSGDIAMLGPIITAQAQATTALTGKKMLTVLSEADALSINSSIPDVYNITPSAAPSFVDLGKLLKSKGIKTLSFVYDPTNSNQPALMSAGAKTLSAYGVTVEHKISVDQTQPQFTATMNNVTSSGVDAVYLLTAGAAPIQMRELKQDGYKGLILDYVGPASAVAAAGSAANGAIQLAYFTTLKPANSVASQFISGFTKAEGKAPSAFDVEGYDSVLFVVKALQASKTDTRAGAIAGAAEVAKSGFQGAQGDYTFQSPDFANRRAVISPMYIQYGPAGTPIRVVSIP